MKMHRLEVYVLDFEGYGVEEYVQQITNARGMSAMVKETQTAEIGEWDDKSPLNMSTTDVEVFRDYFDAQGAKQ